MVRVDKSLKVGVKVPAEKGSESLEFFLGLKIVGVEQRLKSSEMRKS